MNTVEKGNWSEKRVQETLIALGFRDVRRTKYKHPYDLEVDGRPVEVKYCGALSGEWQFQTGKYKGRGNYPVVGYVFCLDNVPGESDWVFLVIPGPLPTRYFRTSRRLLKGAHKHMIGNWKTLQAEPYPLRPLSEIPQFAKMPRTPKTRYLSVKPITPLGSKIAALAAKNPPVFVRTFLQFSGFSVSEFARSMMVPVKHVQDAIGGRAPMSAALIHAIETMRYNGGAACPENPDPYS